MKQSHRWIGLIFSCAVVVAFGGCGSDEPSLTLAGQITRNGQPLAIAADEYASLNFYELRPDGSLGVNSFSATSLQPDGTYSAPIEEGKYRVSFQLMKKADHKDLLGGKYAQADSPLTVEVTGSVDNHTIAIED